MASTTTTTCDRCGSVIAQTGATEERPRLLGTIQAGSSLRWEDQHRATWDLCGPCYDTAIERLTDVIGRPHREWVRSEGELEAEIDTAAVAQAIG